MTASRIHQAGRCAVVFLGCVRGSLAFAEGPFDPAFSHDGLYLYVPAQYAAPAGILQDQNGRLLVATTAGKQLAITRHMPDGQLDNTFGTSGMASNYVYVDSDSYAWATSLVVDHQGRPIIGGGYRGEKACSGGGTALVENSLVVRLSNVPGSESDADSDFGTFGVGYFGDCLIGSNGLAGVAVGPDDSVFGVGTVLTTTYEASVVKWNENGTIDSEFGTGGVGHYYSPSADGTDGVAITSDSTGRLLVATQSYKSTSHTNTSQSGAVVRFTSKGQLDSTFANAGVFDLGALSPDIFTHNGSLCCVRVDNMGRVVIAGLVVDIGSDKAASTRAFVARLAENGAPDESFGRHGFAWLGETWDSIAALSLDHNGRATVAGTTISPYSVVAAVTVEQLNLDGTSNTAVGFGGFFGAEFGYSPYARSLLLDSNGRIVVGTADYLHASALIRYDQIFGDGLD